MIDSIKKNSVYKTLCTLFLWFFLFASAKRAEPRGV
jgi:hypothetical protein